MESAGGDSCNQFFLEMYHFDTLFAFVELYTEMSIPHFSKP